MAARVPPHAVSLVAMFRYAVLSQVEVRVLGGQVRAEAVRQVAAQAQAGPDGRPRKVSTRSIYRWVAAYHAKGLTGLEPKTRTAGAASRVLDGELVVFLVAAKTADPKASVPDLIELAVEEGLLHDANEVDRTTVWRALRRTGTSTRRVRRPPDDTRRFAYRHRLQLVLVDGKHFRVGPTGVRRVALFFLDDATRYVLFVVVGPSESAVLFLRGLLGVLRRFGRFDAVYFDLGPGFDAHDSHEVLANLGIAFVHGTAGYPAARGKIERFNQTAEKDLLRTFARPEVDPDCASLEVRIDEYLRQTYNPRGHEGLDGDSPLQRFLADERSLRPYEDDAALRAAFVLRESRRVSNDHVLPFGGVAYEAPRGLAGKKVDFVRDAFDPTDLRIEHDGEWVRLAPVDPHANAHARRGQPGPPESPDLEVPTTAAARAVDAALAPITQPDGGYADTQEP